MLSNHMLAATKQGSVGMKQPIISERTIDKVGSDPGFQRLVALDNISATMLC